MRRIGTKADDILHGANRDDVLFGRGGNDQLFGGAGADALYGEAGNDTLDGGLGDDLLYGGIDDDSLLGGAGMDRLFGGAGNDRLDGGDGDDVLRGGIGNDQLNGGTGVDRAVLTGVRTDYSFTRLDETHVLVTDLRDGGDGSDTLSLDIEYITFADGELLLAELTPPSLTVIQGTDNDDVLRGTSGIDRLIGGKGNDRLEGGAGIDVAVFSGDRSEYTIKRIDGQFVEVAHIGADNSDGVDTLYFDVERLEFRDGVFDVGSLAVSGGRTYLGGDGVDILCSTLGWDYVVLKGGDDIVNGTIYDFSSIYIDAGDGNDIVSGSDGANTLLGGAGDDQINGQMGNDTIVGGTGNDQLDGGIGSDVAVFTGSAADYSFTRLDPFRTQVTDSRVGGDGTDIVSGVEQLRFTDGDDTIDGQGGDDVIYGMSGFDTLFGGIGDDTLDGGGNRDQLYGGEDNDTLHFESTDTVVSGGTGYDTAIANPDFSSDSVSFEGIERFIFNGGATWLDASTNTNDAEFRINGDFANVRGGSFADAMHVATIGQAQLRAGAGNDVLSSGNGNDHLFGEAGDDQIFGGQGHDLIDGGAGNDWLDGGLGFDTYFGGAGADRFVVGMQEPGDDFISDFQVGEDMIDLSGQGLAYDQLQIAQAGTVTEVTYGGHTLHLNNVVAATVTVDMFWL